MSKLWLYVICAMLGLAMGLGACAPFPNTPLATQSVSLEPLVALGTFPLPETWTTQFPQPQAYSDTMLQEENCIEGYYQKWHPLRDELTLGREVVVMAKRFDSIGAARRGYRWLPTRWRESLQPNTAYEYESPWANESAVLCNEISLATCRFTARYSDIVVIVSVMFAGEDISLSQAPEIFQAVDTHVHTLLGEASGN